MRMQQKVAFLQRDNVFLIYRNTTAPLPHLSNVATNHPLKNIVWANKNLHLLLLKTSLNKYKRLKAKKKFLFAKQNETEKHLKIFGATF